MEANLITTSEVDATLKNHHLVLLDIFATWCGPCQMLMPIINRVADHFAKDDNVAVVKMNGDENESYLANNGVNTYPTVILYKDGKEVDRFIGFKDQDFIVNFIKKHS